MQHSTSSVPLSVPEWLNRLHDNSLQAIPTRFLPEPLLLIRPQHANADNLNYPCHMQTTSNEAVTLHSAALPDLVCTATTVIAPNQPIAALPLGHPWLSLIAPTRARSAGFHPNAKIRPVCTASPNPLCTVIALRSIGPNEIILAFPSDDMQLRPSIQIVGQFDGSCLREDTLGGAGYVVYWGGPFLRACFFLRFEDQKRAPSLSYCFASISIGLRPSRPASKPASKLALRCFVLISMVSRHWSSRLALRPAFNFVSSYKLLVSLQFPST